MEKARLKIKGTGRKELLIGKSKMSIPKEFDFSELNPGNYECEVVREAGGTISKIIVNGKELPKKEVEINKRKERVANQKKAREKDKELKINQRDKTIGNSKKDSFKLRYSKVPKDVREISNDIPSDNFALKYYKFARWEEHDKDSSKSKFSFFAGQKSGNYEIKSNGFGNMFNFKKYCQKRIETTESLFGQNGNNVMVSIFQPDWNLIVGLGTDSVYETGITLHHIYGFPYIPASAIKGICNHYAQDNEFDKEENAKKEKYDAIFGTQKQKGKIIFFDAFPTDIPHLKTDVMNVHYPDWYDKGTPPTDTQSPRPIFFLTVHKTSFQFILAAKTEGHGEELNTAMTWLTNALQDKGIGAKTAVGYGYFSQVNEK